MPPKDYPLPSSLRERLGRPLGKLFADAETTGRQFRSELEKASFVITVGDRVTERISELGRTPDVQVVDGRERRVERKLPDVEYEVMIRVRNPPGMITGEALRGISETFKKRRGPVRVLVEGEEDLLAIPAVIAAPLGANLYYGQPLVGVVLVRVDLAAKKRNRALLKKMGIAGL